jgi:probable HAF family extracellular repeat protein
MRDLGDLPGGQNHSYANDINSSGQVVGYSFTLPGERPFLWTSDGGMIELGVLTGEASAINDQGQVVGRSGPHAFLWTSAGGMQDLNDLVDASGAGWTLRRATAINNYGQIVGNGINSQGAEHAILLTPIPEPSTLNVVMAVLVVASAARARRARCACRGRSGRSRHA